MHQIGCKIDEVRVDGDLKALRRDLQPFADLRMEAVGIPVHGVDAIKGGLPMKNLKTVINTGTPSVSRGLMALLPGPSGAANPRIPGFDRTP